LSLQHHEGIEQYMQNFIFRLEGMRFFGDLSTDNINIKKDFMKVKYEAVAYSHVSRDWNQWRAVVNRVVNVGLY